MIVHAPPSSLDYKHAGDEIWYPSDEDEIDDDHFYVECQNRPNFEENQNCSNRLWLTTGIKAHLNYMG